MAHNLDIANQVIVFAVFALSLNLLMGFAGQASIAHAAFGAVGGYTAALLSIHAGLPFLAALVLALVTGALAGALVSMPALGLGEQYVILLTLATAYIVVSLANGIQYFGAEYGLQGLKPIEVFGKTFKTPTQVFPLYLVIGLIVFAVCWRVGRSAYGRVLKGLREEEPAVRALGRNTFVYKTTIFAMTSAVAGLGGGMLVYYYQQVSPRTFGIDQSIAMMAMVVLGGSGNLIGSVLGAALVVSSTPILQSVVNLNPTDATFIRLAIYGALLVLFMVFRPAGILPEPRRTTRLARGLAAVAGVPGSRAVDVPVQPRPAPERTGPGPVGGVTAGPDRVPRGEPADALLQVRERAPEAPPAVRETAPALTVTGLRKTFGGITAVDEVDLVLPEREVTALIGPNGAGKSTVFGLLTGFIRPDAGEIRLRDQDIRGLSPDRIAKLGMVRSFQDTKLFRRLSVIENVMLGVRENPGDRMHNLFLRPLGCARGERRARATALDALSTVGLADKAEVIAGSLGHGEQKLAAIARILATGADIMLLDEPTSGVDPMWVGRVAETIRGLPALGKTVCIVEHNLGFLEQLAAPVYFMEAGRVRQQGWLRDLMADESLRHAYFGV